MAHERKDIRDAMISMLATPLVDVYPTAAGARVTKSRQSPIRTHELPLINVYMAGEVVLPASHNTAPRELRRTVTIAVDGWVIAADRDAEKLDDTLDALALQIETALDADLNLNGKAFTSGLMSTEMGVTDDGGRPMGCVHLEYAVQYHTDLRVSIDDADEFESMNIRTRVNDPDMATADQAEDNILDIQE